MVRKEYEEYEYVDTDAHYTYAGTSVLRNKFNIKNGEEYMNSLLQKYRISAKTKQEIAEQLVDILDNLNYMHPFREGNGRTQREVIRTLALAKGYYADINVDTDDEIYHLYMDGTVDGDKSILKELFLKILEEIDD